MLKRLSVSYLTSAPTFELCPEEGGPEIAFAGRSNAGKSSVLNRLTGDRNTAKVSKTPGRTQMLNFFDALPQGRIVDLPGYGFAKANRQAQAVWQKAVNNYLSLRDTLGALVLIMDIRHPFREYDLELLEWVNASELPHMILLNKADKMKPNAGRQVLADAKREFPQSDAMMFSATKGTGNDQLIEWLLQQLGEETRDLGSE